MSIIYIIIIKSETIILMTQKRYLCQYSVYACTLLKKNIVNILQWAVSEIFNIGAMRLVLTEEHLAASTHYHINQQNRDVGPTLVYCWADVVDGGPTVNQRWADVSCLLGDSFTLAQHWLKVRDVGPMCNQRKAISTYMMGNIMTVEL